MNRAYNERLSDQANTIRYHVDPPVVFKGMAEHIDPAHDSVTCRTGRARMANRLPAPAWRTASHVSTVDTHSSPLLCLGNSSVLALSGPCPVDRTDPSL